MSAIKTGDYLVIEVEDKKHLVLLTSKHTKGDDMHGTLEKNRHLGAKTVEFSDKQIIATLGPKPAPGTVYGEKVEPWLKTKPHDFWGDIHYFRHLDKTEAKALKIALNLQAEVLIKMRVGFFAPLELEIRPSMGKYAGMYKYTGKADAKDTMILKPKSFADATSQEIIKPKYWTNYLIQHESAHGIWYRGCSAKVKARWIEAYHATLLLAEASAKDVHRLGKDFVKAGLTIPDFKSELEEDKQKLLDSCIVWIKDYHNLTRSHVEILCEANEFGTIAKLWPNEKIMDNDFEIPLGDYAATKPEEFFAEAFAMHYGGKVTIPKNIAQLMEKTIAKVKQ